MKPMGGAPLTDRNGAAVVAVDERLKAAQSSLERAAAFVNLLRLALILAEHVVRCYDQ